MTIIIALGINVGLNLFTNELKDYYICVPTLNIGLFEGGISGTAYSAYPFKDSRKSPVYCGTSEDKGTWIKLSVYDSILKIEG